MASLSVSPSTIINKPIMSFPLLARHSPIRCQMGKIPMVYSFNMKPKTHVAAKGPLQCLSSTTTQQDVRLTFPADIWADRVGSFAFNQSEFESYDRQVELLKKDVEAMLMTPTSDAVEKIVLVDKFCRLGVSYHFERKTEDQLYQIFTSQPNLLDNKEYDIDTIGLLFRVFRQHGFKMSSDVFKRFKDENHEKFNKSLINDARGMLSLYEAAQLSVHGEDILDEALSFTTAHLGPLADASNSHFANEILNALKHPLHKGMARLKAREYISFYESDAPNETLLKFAKLDFNRVQLLYRKELRDIFKWDRGVLDQLPADYPKNLYGAFLDFFDDLDNHAAREGRSYAVSITRDRFKEIARAYLIERQWIRDKYTPTFEESLEQLGIITGGEAVLTATGFLGMGEVAGIESYQWLRSEPVPAIIRAIQLIARLSNDIVAHKYDEESGYAASPFFSCMRQYKMSEMEAMEEFRKMVSKEWKTVNEEWMKSPTPVPRVLLTRVVNIARVLQTNYASVDCLTHGKQVEEYIKGMFIEPVPIN